MLAACSLGYFLHQIHAGWLQGILQAERERAVFVSTQWGERTKECLVWRVVKSADGPYTLKLHVLHKPLPQNIHNLSTSSGRSNSAGADWGGGGGSGQGRRRYPNV